LSEGSESASGYRRAHLFGQPNEEADVVDRSEPVAKQLVVLEQVVQVGGCVAGAATTVTAGLERSFLLTNEVVFTGADLRQDRAAVDST
jgi:hypothetical protein